MEKERKIKTLSLVALIVAVLGLTVAFAALSQTLTINGTASVNAAEWDIHFEALNDNGTQGDGKINGTPIINGTTISNLNLSIRKPNDMVSYGFKVVNNGTINAKLNSFDVPKLCTLQSPIESCDWNNDGEVTQEDVDNVNSNINLLVQEIIPCNENDDYKYCSDSSFDIVDSLLNSKKEKIYTVSLLYGKVDLDALEIEESTELPKRELTFNNLSITFNYVQAN